MYEVGEEVSSRENPIATMAHFTASPITITKPLFEAFLIFFIVEFLLALIVA